MERAIDWVLFIGIFIVFPTLAYQIHAELPDVSWFTIALVSFISAGLICAIFVTPLVAIVGAVFRIFSRH
ncbi:TPA: hypothetical protein ACPGPY_000317 [Haemophilus influenzae]|uniref:hypothetical protein n=1 Tax=Haemophilus influenzae TaxID=727 RepID=UPI000DD4ADCD|nr:hypothetical protein [Haemophilus influenzae]MCK9001428.1 hypothetical protein [Haemophilus influenzae]MCK9071666.1 hypothetical protein [Haemophilus influenzae]MCK9075368.1 hypothetical protein [Haemophilus influenzae]RFO86283.1 hypothetical protein CH553_04235 [Haemophilus influenzae]